MYLVQVCVLLELAIPEVSGAREGFIPPQKKSPLRTLRRQATAQKLLIDIDHRTALWLELSLQSEPPAKDSLGSCPVNPTHATARARYKITRRQPMRTCERIDSCESL